MKPEIGQKGVKKSPPLIGRMEVIHTWRSFSLYLSFVDLDS